MPVGRQAGRGLRCRVRAARCHDYCCARHALEGSSSLARESPITPRRCKATEMTRGLVSTAMLLCLVISVLEVAIVYLCTSWRWCCPDPRVTVFVRGRRRGRNNAQMQSGERCTRRRKRERGRRRKPRPAITVLTCRKARSPANRWLVSWGSRAPQRSLSCLYPCGPTRAPSRRQHELMNYVSTGALNRRRIVAGSGEAKLPAQCVVERGELLPSCLGLP